MITSYHTKPEVAGLHGAVGSASDCRPHLDHTTFVETDHDLISTAVILLLLIQERQLSVTDESVYTSTG